MKILKFHLIKSYKFYKYKIYCEYLKIFKNIKLFCKYYKILQYFINLQNIIKYLKND